MSWVLTFHLGEVWLLELVLLLVTMLGSPRQSWQNEASSRVEQHSSERLDLFPRFTDTEQTTLRSQSGPAGGAFLSTTPTNPLTKIDFAFPFLCRRASAGVAAPLILLTTTVLHVPVQGFGMSGFCNRECRRTHLQGRWGLALRSLWMGLGILGAAQLAVDATMRVLSALMACLAQEPLEWPSPQFVNANQRTYPDMTGRHRRC